MNHIADFIRTIQSQDTRPCCAYLYDLDHLRRHARQAMQTLPPSCQLYYAIKANSEARILKTLSPIVHGFEVASGGEIEKVRAVDGDAPIMFGGPGKSDEEIVSAIRHRVKLLNVESLHELQRVKYYAAQINASVPILLRVNLSGPLPAAKLHMAGAPTQFGIAEEDVPKAIALARQCDHVDLHGFHFHSISNNLDALQHVQLIRHYITASQAWAETFGVDLRHLNVGGGIGINYAHLNEQFDWQTFTFQLGSLIKELRPDFTLLFECGRYLSAACGYYAAEVLDLKLTHGKWFAVLRGGSHHFRLPSSWQHSHPFRIVPVDDWRFPFPRPEVHGKDVTLAGELCSPKDLLARDVPVERLRVGDIVLFLHAGAYGWHISHHDFLSHPHPQMHYFQKEGETQSRNREPKADHLSIQQRA
ncbi:putative Diaminopimelate decarboxylase, Siderophore biosynthesis protein SbnH [Nitrospina gracilis 3/211]|uniref:Putative Diaminopimelate decarboxylase, Siderophore biosynthesis protein SbnH n=1 Tax=Nitrospina gracilis (strain 3/211) TaxID=1266370 RepID=M1YZ00_NITG3|nr:MULTISPECIES: type III PLP-dependent enzyme [Nitrospina]MCF8723606.1 diaminopimelate decarboxylase [Nitrospina sp. Nb-3]CCQ90686.1 putative Diaminopimelate decarboxylase, Siderophore biosynthesis protein SbnH [Nitrospina gracilis 3/211]